MASFPAPARDQTPVAYGSLTGVGSFADVVVGALCTRAPVAVTGLADLAAVRPEPAHQRQDLAALLAGQGRAAGGTEIPCRRSGREVLHVADNHAVHEQRAQWMIGKAVEPQHPPFVVDPGRVDEHARIGVLPHDGPGQETSQVGHGFSIVRYVERMDAAQAISLVVEEIRCGGLDYPRADLTAAQFLGGWCVYSREIIADGDPAADLAGEVARSVFLVGESSGRVEQIESWEPAADARDWFQEACIWFSAQEPGSTEKLSTSSLPSTPDLGGSSRSRQPRQPPPTTARPWTRWPRP